MAKFKVQKDRNYTVMGNYHLRDKNLSNKSRGLLSTMLSLPDNWDYTMKGLTSICKDGMDGIATQIKELETRGYLVRKRVRDDHGRLKETEYDVYERPYAHLPIREKPKQEKPVQGKPVLEKPNLEFPVQENPEQINIDRTNIEEINTHESKYPSIYQDRTDTMDQRRIYENIIRENIDYEYLLADGKVSQERLDEIVSLLVDTVCSSRPTIRVNGEEMPHAVVKSRLLKLNAQHIEYLVDAMNNAPADIRNIRAYMLTGLYNASLTIDSYYTARVNHDFHAE